MFKSKKSNEESSNFWISYADLMAGLLFVFILLIGAIIVKSTVLKNSLKESEETLEEQSKNIVNKDETIFVRDYEINKLHDLLAKREKSIESAKKELLISKETLELKADEIQKLNQILLAKNSKITDYSNHILILEDIAKENNKTKIEQNITIDKYKNQVFILSNSLSEKKEKLELNDKKLLQLLQAVDNRQTKYDKLLIKLQEQKAKIKSLTGIKLKVIAELKSALGNSINIDKKSGSLRLASNILFDKGSSALKDGSKKELKSNFIKYVNTLISNKNISEYLDKIIIEGHTDSDGGYLYNLELSQKRAFAVMNYLLTLDYIKKNNIERKLVASGRSYLDAIKKDNIEDKDASRRIEIKFRLKNQDAMYEIERILDAD
jgi:chemotaxis protein MotB